MLDATHLNLIQVPNWYWRNVFCCITAPGSSLAGYKLTPTSYRALLVTQRGVCGICRRGTWRLEHPAPLAVDHDHVCCRDRKRTCGKCVRGLLCPSCNGYLGLLELYGLGRMPAGWERRALQYLARHGCDPTAPYRRWRLVDEHRQRVAGWDPPCRCRHCAPPA